MKKFVYIILLAFVFTTLAACGSEIEDSRFLTRQQKLDILVNLGGLYSPESRRFVDDANDVTCFLNIESYDAVIEWYETVISNLSDEDLLATPSLFKAVVYFGTDKQALYDYNEALHGADPASTDIIPGFVIEAVYMDPYDMMRQLANVTSLYYDGSVYSFNEVVAGVEGIPDEVIREFAEEVEPIFISIYGEEQYEAGYKAAVDALKAKG